METCFARSHKLQNYDDPVYIKKLLSPDDRALEKKILAKRYDMIANQGKDKSQFKTRNYNSSTKVKRLKLKVHDWIR